MSGKKDSKEIVVRKVQFEFPEDFHPHWNAAKPEFSQIFNSVSFMAPHFEPFIIDAVRAAAPHITDPEVQKEAAGLSGQETQHYRQHRRFNTMLIAKGYDGLRAHDQQLERDYAEIRTRPLKFQLAFAAGLETLALAGGHMIVNLREYLFSDADPVISSLWMWHLMEEIEHKNAAFDVYQHVYGDYWYRVYGMAYGLVYLFWRLRQGYKIMLQADGKWGKWKTRWAIKRLALRFWSSMLPHIARCALPWHHPSKVADPAWMREWVTRYDQGEKELLTLDTTKLQLSSPVPLPAR
ncbi:MAG: metal-dependent hydrolase [Candidatus Binatia bacterium]